MKDNYVKRFEAKVLEVLEDGVVLDRTAFYPLRGGVDCDKGMLVAGKKHDVTAVVWRDGKVVHLTDVTGLKPGMPVHGEIEWGRRYQLMRNHTASHLLEAMVFRKTGALIGSGNVSVDRSHLGFTLENMDRSLIEQAVADANAAVDRGAPVTVSFMKREEAMKIPEIVKLAGKLPPAVKELRIIEIDGIDRQACGGPHIADISEIGHIETIKLENKGKNNRRLYFKAI